MDRRSLFKSAVLSMSAVLPLRQTCFAKPVENAGASIVLFGKFMRLQDGWGRLDLVVRPLRGEGFDEARSPAVVELVSIPIGDRDPTRKSFVIFREFVSLAYDGAYIADALIGEDGRVYLVRAQHGEFGPNNLSIVTFEQIPKIDGVDKKTGLELITHADLTTVPQSHSHLRINGLTCYKEDDLLIVVCMTEEYGKRQRLNFEYNIEEKKWTVLPQLPARSNPGVPALTPSIGGK